jgi:hypothetical protein
MLSILEFSLDFSYCQIWCMLACFNFEFVHLAWILGSYNVMLPESLAYYYCSCSLSEQLVILYLHTPFGTVISFACTIYEHVRANFQLAYTEWQYARYYWTVAVWGVVCVYIRQWLCLPCDCRDTPCFAVNVEFLFDKNWVLITLEKIVTSIYPE